MRTNKEIWRSVGEKVWAIIAELLKQSIVYAWFSLLVKLALRGTPFNLPFWQMFALMWLLTGLTRLVRWTLALDIVKRA